jgi:hypothetical protein
MTSPTDNIAIDLEFIVEPADLFRASLRLAKTRIIVGLAVSLALVFGLVTFFLIIDEQKILLQTSPLFVGLPLLAVGGQVLRLHASCRQYVHSLSASQRRVRYSFSDQADGFRVASGESFSQISWNEVRKAVEDPKRFMLSQTKFDIHLVPKSAFRDANAIRLFRQILLTKLANRAHLLN